MGTVEYLFRKECLMTRQIFQIYLYWYDYNKTIPDNYSINRNLGMVNQESSSGIKPFTKQNIMQKRYCTFRYVIRNSSFPSYKMVELWKSLLAIVSVTQMIAVEGNKLNYNYLNEFECPI